MNADGGTLLDVLKEARGEVGKVIIGQDQAIDRALIAIFTGHHALVEGVPGVAKTLLVRTLARVLGCEFGRIQFTPDLMPADITGTNVFNLKTGEFALIRGPIFTTFLLADEINRAPAKTQSALLQAMHEGTVAAGKVRAVVGPGVLEGLRRSLETLTVREDLLAYVVDIVRRSREHESVLVGAGPRATQALMLASRAHAALEGRDFVTPDDIKAMACAVLEHRLILRPEFEIEGLALV